MSCQKEGFIDSKKSLQNAYLLTECTLNPLATYDFQHFELQKALKISR
jgi:predicted cupin superfamily sugar epimerase